MADGTLLGKRAVVTGAASGMGRATAERFGREGALVALLDTDVVRLVEVCRTLEQAGAKALAIPVDVSNEDQMSGAIAQVTSAWDGLDIVVANAAVQMIGRDAAVDQLEFAVWQRTIDVNLTGVFLSCKHGIRALLASGGGAVVCTASPTSLFGFATDFDAYTASKAGVLGLMRVMAAEYAQRGVRVNAVIPGFIDTPLVKEIMLDDMRRDALLERIPMRRPGRASEVASMVAYLVSDEASYVTGAAVAVDGGQTAV